MSTRRRVERGLLGYITMRLRYKERTLDLKNRCTMPLLWNNIRLKTLVSQFQPASEYQMTATPGAQFRFPRQLH